MRLLRKGGFKLRALFAHFSMNFDVKMHLFLKLTDLIANNCIKLLLLTSEQNLCEMALVKKAVRNGADCYHHDSKIFVLLCLFLPQGPTL